MASRTTADGFVLIATVGQNDVQVVLNNAQGQCRRYPLHKDTLRRFHQDCVSGRLDWTMLPLQETPFAEAKGLSLIYDAKSMLLECSHPSRDFDNYVEPQDCRQGVTLCAPLMSKAHQVIQKMKLGRARHVVVLNTRREQCDDRDEPKEKGEPIGAVHLFRQVVADAFSLQSVDLVEEHVFLSAEDMYETDIRNQQHLLAAAANKIDQRIRALRQQYPSALAVISDIAGLPETKSVLAASVDYRFDGQYVYARATEGGRASARRNSILISPAESLTTRHQIVRLVCSGSFDAAAQLSKHPLGPSVYDVEPWRRSVEMAAEFLRTGELGSDTGRAAGSTPGLLANLRSMARSLVVLFRIEAALRRQDVESAVCDTVTYAELALMELAEKYLSKPGVSCVDWSASQIIAEHAVFTLEGGPSEEDPAYIVPRSYDTIRAIAACLETEVERAWKRVFHATRKEEVSRARNAATHARVTTARLQAARDRLIKEDLWNFTPAGVSILRANLPARLNRELGIANAGELYDKLLASLLKDLDALSFREF